MATGLAIQNEAWRAFDAWYAEQDDEVQDMEIQDAIELYSRSRPVVAPQQPARNATTNSPDAFRNMFAILHNLETSDLPFMTAEQRRVFFNDPCVAILRLDDARLDALYALVQARQPERYRDAV